MNNKKDVMVLFEVIFIIICVINPLLGLLVGTFLIWKARLNPEIKSIGVKCVKVSLGMIVFISLIFIFIIFMIF